MKAKTWDNLITGLVAGLIGGVIGFLIYGGCYSFSHGIAFSDLFTRVFLANKLLRSPILSLSVLFDIIPFYIFLNRGFYKGARGVMLAIFIFAIFIVYFRFFS